MIVENKPQIEVLLSTYNGEKYLVKQIDSILAQEDVEVTCLIRDDGSIDGTKDILKQYSEEYPKNILPIWGQNEGFARSFYHLVEDSGDFDFFAFSDQDDYWLPQKLAKGISSINGRSDIPEMYFCNAMLVDSKLNPIRVMFDDLKIPTNKVLCLLECLSAGCTIVFNKTARDWFLRGDINKIGYHDFWMYDICSLFGKVIYDPIPYILYRQHDNNIIGSGNGYKKIWGQRIRQIKKRSHLREFLSNEVIRCFPNFLTDQQIHDISLIANYRKSIITRMKLLFSDRLYLNTRRKQFWFKCHVILGNV